MLTIVITALCAIGFAAALLYGLYKAFTTGIELYRAVGIGPFRRIRFAAYLFVTSLVVVYFSAVFLGMSLTTIFG